MKEYAKIACQGRGRREKRDGKIAPRLILVILMLIAAGFVVTKLNTSRKSGVVGEKTPITSTVIRGPFISEVVERGDIESSSNVEIRCEVRSRNSSGTTILEIVPEGTYVKEDDFLVRLDDSALQAELLQQEITCNTSQSRVVEAETDLETAIIELAEYEEGTYRQEYEQLESSEFVAQENLRRAEEYIRYSEKLAERGYVSEVQLEADRFSVEKAKKELDVARTKLYVLEKFTKKKLLNQLKARVLTGKARLSSRKNSYILDERQLSLLNDQIEKCVIKASSSGQVVYAISSKSKSTTTAETLIEEGYQVRARQVIIRLPDPKNMQVVTKINESKIDSVKVGMKTKIKIDAFPKWELTGVVRSVSEYPHRNSNSWMSHIKDYGTEIVVYDPPEGLRAGMTAEIAIQVEQLEDVLQVPPQAVLGRQGKFYCLLFEDETTITVQEVQLGSANETYVVVEKGLSDGDQVILSPQSYEDQVDIPEAGLPEQVAAQQPADNDQTNSTSKSSIAAVKRTADKNSPN